MLSDVPLINVIEEQIELFNINEHSKSIWLLSPAFDASLSDIYTAILSGGSLYIPELKMDKVKSIIKYMNLYKITHADLSPSILYFFHKLGIPLSLKVIIFGGEVGSEKIIKDIMNTTNVSLFNAYGPTETTVCASVSKVNDHWISNNIGKPFKNINYRIEKGELHIGGENVALGYLNELLNNKFYVENDMKWYKTGDLVKEVNGDYFYLGRQDNQFKHHGQLICSEELENAAYQAGVEMSACIYNEESKKINLFYVGEILENVLKVRLSERLNTYMLPHYIFKEAELPKNANGKIDVRKLKEKIK